MRHDIYDITRGTEQFIIIFELLSWSLLNFPMQNILFAWMKCMDIIKYLTNITNYTLLYLTVWESSEALPTTLRYRHLISSSFWLYWTIVTRFSLIGYASRLRTITATSNGSEEKSLYRCRHNASRRNTEQDQSTSYLCKYYFFLIVFLSHPFVLLNIKPSAHFHSIVSACAHCVFHLHDYHFVYSQSIWLIKTEFN